MNTNTTVRRNGNVEINGKLVGTVAKDKYGAWESKANGSTTITLHNTRAEAVEALANGTTDAPAVTRSTPAKTAFEEKFPTAQSMQDRARQLQEQYRNGTLDVERHGVARVRKLTGDANFPAIIGG